MRRLLGLPLVMLLCVSIRADDDRDLDALRLRDQVLAALEARDLDRGERLLDQLDRALSERFDRLGWGARSDQLPPQPHAVRVPFGHVGVVVPLSEPPDVLQPGIHVIAQGQRLALVRTTLRLSRLEMAVASRDAHVLNCRLELAWQVPSEQAAALWDRCGSDQNIEQHLVVILSQTVLRLELSGFTAEQVSSGEQAVSAAVEAALRERLAAVGLTLREAVLMVEVPEFVSVPRLQRAESGPLLSWHRKKHEHEQLTRLRRDQERMRAALEELRKDQ